MKRALSLGVCALALFGVGATQAGGNWQEIFAPLNTEYNVTVGGEEFVVRPGCALDQMLVSQPPYSFYFKEGKTDKLVVYFNGGGACWDKETCVDSLSLENPSYVPSAALPQNKPELASGILNPNNPDNPYADWSMLFVSYCTGDVHVGSADIVYDAGFPFVVQHRGFDNFVYAMDWLKTNHPEIAPRKILDIGSSAGAYGAAINYPWIREFYPDVDKVFLVGDAGYGVLDAYNGSDTSEFINAVFNEDPSANTSWNIQYTLHPTLAALPASVNVEPSRLISHVYQTLASEYPKDKFAQYTNAYDVIQMYFWDIMLNWSTPALWGAGLEDPDFIAAWNRTMVSIDAPLQFDLSDNYRSFVAPGCDHTIFRFDEFYTTSLTGEDGDQISFPQWLQGMTEGKNTRSDWQNLSCTPGIDCGEEDLNPEGIGACLDRSFGG